MRQWTECTMKPVKIEIILITIKKYTAKQNKFMRPPQTSSNSVFLSEFSTLHHFEQERGISNWIQVLSPDLSRCSVELGCPVEKSYQLHKSAAASLTSHNCVEKCSLGFQHADLDIKQCFHCRTTIIYLFIWMWVEHI